LAGREAALFGGSGPIASLGAGAARGFSGAPTVAFAACAPTPTATAGAACAAGIGSLAAGQQAIQQRDLQWGECLQRKGARGCRQKRGDDYCERAAEYFGDPARKRAAKLARGHFRAYRVLPRARWILPSACRVLRCACLPRLHACPSSPSAASALPSLCAWLRSRLPHSRTRWHKRHGWRKR
jgi:hypothetical protein